MLHTLRYNVERIDTSLLHNGREKFLNDFYYVRITKVGNDSLEGKS